MFITYKNGILYSFLSDLRKQAVTHLRLGSILERVMPYRKQKYFFAILFSVGIPKQYYTLQGKYLTIDVAITAIKSSSLNLLRALSKFNKPFY